MKKIILALALLCPVCTITTAWAQIAAYRQGNSATVEGYSLPRTVISVTITQEREVVLRGPYAKFASQYLGVSGAALTDKESYKLIDAQLSYFEEPDPAQAYLFDEKTSAPVKIFQWLSQQAPSTEGMIGERDYASAQIGNQIPFKDMGISAPYGQTTQVSYLGSEEEFPELPISRTEAVEKSPEQMAADAADAIFKLRKRRFDLITGEQGENVFGQGLKAALEEMDRIENEYLSLFLGKRFTQRTTRTINVLPQAGQNRVTVCRFSDSKGVVDPSDVSGRPILVEMSAEADVAATAPAARKGGRTVTYRIPQVQNAKLMDGTRILSSERIPVYQLGSLVDVPVVYGL